MRILIVEDEPRAARGLRNLLEEEDETIEILGIAADGKEALDQIRLHVPDVVITDIRMPGMDGMELIRSIRAQNFSCRIVIVSAYEEFDIAREALSLGVTDYLVKPIVKDDIRRLLDKLQNRKHRWEQDSDLIERYPKAQPLVRHALKIIEESYQTRLMQRDVAEALGVTAEYFSYLFTKCIGVNFAKFLRSYRIEKAKEFLINGEASRDNVFEKVGFSDNKYFQKCFKEETGMGVGEYLERSNYH